MSRLPRKARSQRAFCFAQAGLLVLVLGACTRGQDDAAAYQVCLEAAKKDPKYGKSKLATQAESNIQASAGDADIRVNIPYELDGKKGLYQCIATKQADGTYKVAF